MSIFEIQSAPLSPVPASARASEERNVSPVLQRNSAASVARTPMQSDRVASAPKGRPILKTLAVGGLIAGGTTGAVLGVRARNANRLPEFAKGIVDPVHIGSVTISGSAAQAYNETRAFAKRSAVLSQIIADVETSSIPTYIRNDAEQWVPGRSGAQQLEIEQVDAELHAPNAIPFRQNAASERLTLGANETEECGCGSPASALLIDLVKAAGNQAHTLVAGVYRALADPYHYTFENHRAAALVRQEGPLLGETVGLMPFRGFGWIGCTKPNLTLTEHGACGIALPGTDVGTSVTSASFYLGALNRTLDTAAPSGLSTEQSAKFNSLQTDFAAFNRTVNENALTFRNMSADIPQRDALYQRAYAFGAEIESSLGRPTDHTFMPREAFPGMPAAEPAAAPLSGHYTVDFPTAPAPARAPASASATAPTRALAPTSPPRRLLAHVVR